MDIFHQRQPKDASSPSSFTGLLRPTRGVSQGQGQGARGPSLSPCTPINTRNAPPIRVFERKTARPARRVEALPHAAPREPRRPSDGPTDRRSDATGRAVTSTPWVIGVAEWLWRLKPLTLGRPSGVFVLNSFGRSIRGMVGSKTQGKGWVVCIG